MSVAAAQSEQAIGSLQEGDAVKAYNPTPGRTEPELVQHIWLNHNRDLVVVHLHPASSGTPTNTTAAHADRLNAPEQCVVAAVALLGVAAAHAAALGVAVPASALHGETIRKTADHLWLTADRSWVQAGDLRAGEPFVPLNSRTGTVARAHMVPRPAALLAERAGRRRDLNGCLRLRRLG